MARLSDDEIREQVRGFLDEAWDDNLTLADWLGRLADSGWACPSWAVGSFGRGLTNDQAAVAFEEFRKVDAPGPPGGLSRMLAAPTIVAHGTEEQKQRYVRAILTGEESWCQLFSEPGAGSDLASLQTRAVRDGEEWVVNGQKVWTSGGQGADLGMLIARTNGDVPKHRGITWFAFEMRQPGVDVRPLKQMTGGTSFCEVFFTDARVAHDGIIGGENEGWGVALTTLANERVGLGGGSAGGFPLTAPGGRRFQEQLQVRLGEFVERSKAARAARPQAPRRSRRGGTGGPGDPMVRLARQLGKDRDPIVRQEIVELYTLQQLSRFNTLRSRAAVAAGQRPGPETSIGKLMVSRITRKSRDVAMHTLGAHGMLFGADAKIGGAQVMSFLSSPAPSIYGGSDEIQKNIVGERVLGLPKEPDPYAELPFRELKVGTQKA